MCIIAMTNVEMRFNMLLGCVSLRVNSADISDDLKDLLSKMLEKNPETRITVPQIKVSKTCRSVENIGRM